MGVKAEQQRNRRNRRELDARKGKEGESEREAAEIHARRGNGKSPGSREWGTKWRPSRRELDARKGNIWRGRKRRETRGQRGRGDPWRSLYRTVERNGESQDGKRRRRKGKRFPRSRKMTKGPLRFWSLLPGGTWAYGPGGHPDPAELTGGDAPPCAEPPVAPTCTARYELRPMSSVLQWLRSVSLRSPTFWEPREDAVKRSVLSSGPPSPTRRIARRSASQARSRSASM